VLGLGHDHAIDLWAVGVTIYEIYTGRIMFPGATNNEMLKFHQDLKGLFLFVFFSIFCLGKLPTKLIRRAQFRTKHFDDNNNFVYRKIDKVTQRVSLLFYTNNTFYLHLFRTF
jgi:serine/threonine-protein kinase PRP4